MDQNNCCEKKRTHYHYQDVYNCIVEVVNKTPGITYWDITCAVGHDNKVQLDRQINRAERAGLIVCFGVNKYYSNTKITVDMKTLLAMANTQNQERNLERIKYIIDTTQAPAH